MRRSVLGVMVVALTIGVSPSAHAKGPMIIEATIAGPGLKVPLTFTADESPPDVTPSRSARRLNLLIGGTRVYDVIYGREGVTAREPGGSLGPSLTVTWTAGFVMGSDGSSDEIGRFQSHLYPFTEGGPVMFTPDSRLGGPGASMFIDAAWSHATPALLDNLRDWGLSEPAPARGPDDRRRAPAPAPPPAKAAAVPWLLVAVGLVAIGGSVHLARRRSPAV